MNVAVVRRWLKVADPTALTARETLQRGLGLGRSVREVRRSDIRLFRGPADQDLIPVLESLCRETNLLANPNKHFLEIRSGGEPLRPEGNVWVLVHAPGEGRELAETLRRHRLVPGSPPETRSAVLWSLDLEGEPDARARLAREIAVVRDRKQGLLANPHVEDAAVLLEPPSAEVLFDRLGGGGSTPAPEMG